MKLCPKCNTEKPLDEFHANSRRKDGRADRCKVCALNTVSQYKDANREKYLRSCRAMNLKRRYGVSLEEYQAQEAAQGGACAVCGVVVKSGVLSQDHDHETGAPRGLLCSGCNYGLGCFRDDIQSLEAAIAYLKEWETPQRKALRVARECFPR